MMRQTLVAKDWDGVRDEVESTVDDLIDAGLVEVFLEDGDVKFRLTPAGRLNINQ